MMFNVPGCPQWSIQSAFTFGKHPLHPLLVTVTLLGTPQEQVLEQDIGVPTASATPPVQYGKLVISEYIHSSPAGATATMPEPAGIK